MNTSLATMTSILIASLAAGSARATTVSEQDVKQNTVVVRYRAADLRTDAGAKALYEKLDHAARFVCRYSYDPLYFEARWAMEACEQDAVANAVSELDNALLTSEYDAHFPAKPLGSDERLSNPRNAAVVATGRKPSA